MLQLSIHIQKVVFCDQFATLSFALRTDWLIRNLRVVVIDGGSLILTVRRTSLSWCVSKLVGEHGLTQVFTFLFIRDKSSYRRFFTNGFFLLDYTTHSDLDNRHAVQRLFG